MVDARLRERGVVCVTYEIFRSAAGHGFQSSTIVLTNLGNRTIRKKSNSFH